MSTKYLTIPERLDLAKKIRNGAYIIRNKQGKIKKGEKNTLYADPDGCKMFHIIDVLSEIIEIGSGTYGTAFQVYMPKKDMKKQSDIS